MYCTVQYQYYQIVYHMCLQEDGDGAAALDEVDNVHEVVVDSAERQHPLDLRQAHQSDLLRSTSR